MACMYPLTGYRGAGGKVTLNRSEGYVDRQLSVSCGQCLGCRVCKAQAWAMRCVCEAQMHSEAGKGSSFLTLTYCDEAVPKGLSLNVRDWQLFAKRVRRELGPFRFYMCGEYGERTLRPHYHALMFGHDFYSDRVPIGSNEFGDRHYISSDLSSLWGLGFATIGEVSFSSAAYVSGYVISKQGGRYAERKYRRNDGDRTWYVKPEFALMSRRPGIGTSWFHKYGADAYPSDFLIDRGKRRRVPKFFDNMLAKVDPDMYLEVKRKRIQNAILNPIDPARLVAREEILIRGQTGKGVM